jgi:hypothetical protein
MTESQMPWPSLRFAFVFNGELDDPAFEERLRIGHLSVGSRRQQADLEVIECELREPGYVCSVTITRSLDVSDMGCIYFSGPNHLDAAVRLGPVFQYLPLRVLHLSARTSPERQIRVGVLQVLSQLYLAEEGGVYWDSLIEETTRVFREGDDPELRRRSLFIEVVGRSPRVVQHLREVLETEKDAEERELLGQLLERAERNPAAPEAPALSEDTLASELRLVLPFWQNMSIDGLLENFDSFCKRMGDVRQGDSRLVELELKDLDARMSLLSPEGSKMGCIYFSGPDAPDVAISVGTMVSYMPPELARRVVRSSGFNDYRQMALHALALSASTKVLPGKGVDAELKALLQAALEDADPEVKATAVAMKLFLRDELSEE